MKNIRIGFSTSDAWYSRAIRNFTHSKVSHTFILFELDGIPMVLEEAAFGWTMITYQQFSRGNRTVATIVPLVDLEKAVLASFNWLGQRYDYGGVVGMFFVEVGRWLGQQWRNPWASAKAMFCSEANTRILQAAGYPASESLDSKSTSPEDLMEYMVNTAKVHAFARQQTVAA